MKNEVNRALVAEKKHYIQPQSNMQTMSFANSICVGSVHGNTGLKYGGDVETHNPGQKPM